VVSPGDLTILVAARDEEGRVGPTVEGLRTQFPGATVIVCDDGSRDSTAVVAAGAGAQVVSCPRLGKGEALNAGERLAPPGPLLLCDADLEGDLRALTEAGRDLAVAAFAERVGGGFGLAREAARALIRARTGFVADAPLSGQRYLSERARAACFPLARGFGCELRMTVDAVRAGLDVVEIELPLGHRPTGRDLPGFAHRGRQLVEVVLATGPLAINHRGSRLPIAGWAAGFAGVGSVPAVRLAVGVAAGVGLLDDLLAGPERGLRGHLR
jgi:hypothetical protein